jgi:AraC-like DNA-binding protein
LEQATLFNDSDKRDVFVRVRNKKKFDGGFNNEELKIIEMRKKLYSLSKIRDNTYYNSDQIKGILKRKFGLTMLEDPLNNYIAKLVAGGKPINEVCRITHVTKGTVSRICKRRGIVPTGVIKEKKIKRKPVDKEQYAKDVYCLLQYGESVEDISRNNGYKSPTSLYKILKEYIPKYREDSVRRRNKSKDMARERRRSRKSKKYRFESEFESSIVNTIESVCNIKTKTRRNSAMEIDLMISHNKKLYVVELKTVCRKVDEARALGQAIINRATMGGDCISAIVYPEDVCTSKYFKPVCIDNNIMVYNENEFKSLFVSII